MSKPPAPPLLLACVTVRDKWKWCVVSCNLFCISASLQSRSSVYNRFCALFGVSRVDRGAHIRMFALWATRVLWPWMLHWQGVNGSAWTSALNPPINADHEAWQGVGGTVFQVFGVIAVTDRDSNPADQFCWRAVNLLCRFAGTCRYFLVYTMLGLT